MKKVMFAAAVAAAGIAGAIESANTVGYNTFDLTRGQKVLKAINFQTVDGGAINLQDIKPYDGANVSDGAFRIWWWEPGVG